jgi:hypothetical protein
VNEQGLSATVQKNTGEVAHFSDSTTVLRWRTETNSDNPNPHFKGVYRGDLQPPIFKNVFATGLTVSQILENLKNPAMMVSPDAVLKFPPPANPKKQITSFILTLTKSDLERSPNLIAAAGRLIVDAGNISIVFAEGKRELVKQMLTEGTELELIEELNNKNLRFRQKGQ